ncbi:hypothetical protein CLV71_108267 [Actinophytocola oryzae]|uniref:Calcineurin-like phosphoesterase family protein n=2 Tax=Actinophytocola oryzae TaxID=502181 RepID=A0A4R7VHS4_9PSEU|nr:hypothetical protein CLV71_108267 [Actinophytocola oryzae]
MSEAELGFRPQKAVRWLAPKVLIATGVQSLIAEIFGSYADKRELQAGLPAEVHDHSEHEELWLDYVADLGDGFDATFSVASVLAAPTLDLDGRTQRGRLLVMGGDEVYPAASTTGYEDRSKGVYRAALPTVAPDAPTLFALPGNHDWYDGLTSFLRVFAQRRPFGGWRTEQTRSYFAVKLPHRWWLYAIDTQFDDYVDAPQLEYFRDASKELREGDAVILCTSTPAWVEAGSGAEAKGYDTFEFFQREIIRPKGADVRVMLSGDKHHYSRYAEQDGTGQLITSGLGGAYLAATHNLPAALTLPPPQSRVREPAEQKHFGLRTRYPAHTDRMAKGIFALPWRNPGFWGLTGVAQLVATMAVLYGLTESGTRHSVFGLLAAWAPAVVIAVVLLAAGVAFASLDQPRRDRKNVVAGVLHALAHLALSTGWALVIRWLYHDVLPDGPANDWLVFLVAAVGTPVVVGFLDAELVALYLLVASGLGINVNEVMAGQSIEDHKGFLRLRIARDGTLTVYPVKIDRVCRAWRPNPNGGPADPWLLPAEPLRAALIEPPIRIPRHR